MYSPCIQNALQNAVRECISRVFCHQDALFPSESLKSCAMGKYCHAFAIPPFARGSARDQCCDLSLTEVVACPSEGASAVARPSLGHQRCGSSFTGVLACPLRGGASAVVHCLSKLALLVISAPSTWRHQRCGSSLMWRCDRRVRPLYGGASVVARPLCGNASTATKKRVHRKVPSWVRPSCDAFLSGKSWQCFVAVHSRRGATGRGTPSQIQRRLRGR